MPIPPPSETQAKILWSSMTALAIGILLGLIGLLGWGVGLMIHMLAPVLWPLAIAGIIAYLLDPMVDFFVRRRVPRGRAIILVFIICMSGVAAVLGQVVPRMVFETKRLIDNVPSYSKTVQEAVGGWMGNQTFLLEWKEYFLPSTKEGTDDASGTNEVSLTVTNEPAASTNLTQAVSGPNDNKPILPDRETASQIAQMALKYAAAVVPRAGEWLLGQLQKVASWAGMIVGLALVPVFTFYLLHEKRGIQRTWTDYLPVRESKLKEEVVFVITAINDYLIAFFRGQVFVAVCIGTLLTIGFLCLGLNYAVLLGVLAGVLSIVPYLGAILTIIPAVSLAAIQFRDWWHPVLVVAIFATVQMLEGLVISPKIMGDRVGLHPMTIIVSVLVGSILLGGILGGVLAIPLTAAMRVIMFRYVWKART